MMKIKMPPLNNMILIIIPIYVFSSMLLSFPSSTEADYAYHMCTDNTTTYTPNSTFQSNLNRLLSTLSSAATGSRTGFFNATISDPRSPSPDNVYGLFLCRGDLAGTDACTTCVAIATNGALARCPVQKQVTIWYDDCMLRYSNASFFSTVAALPRVMMRNPDNLTICSAVNQAREESLNQVTIDSSNSHNKFATNQSNVTAGISLYTLGQCTHDLSAADCSRCLRIAQATLGGCCGGRLGSRSLLTSCNIRSELFSFYSLHNSTSPSGKTRNSSTLKIVVIVVTVAVSLVLFVLGYCFITRRVRKKHYNAVLQDRTTETESDHDLTTTVESLQFDFGTIEAATDNFKDHNKIGEGGFGIVYKGILSNGQEIAVKRMSKCSGQGAREFKNEVVLVAKLQHRNLTRLLGFCLEREETILVYEYVVNKSLDYFLFDPKQREKLDWSTRCTIIRGIARGILYLHEDSRLRVIHRDLKAANILLDGNMNPKVSDFGMAKMLGLDDQTYGNTKRVVGTYGYMAPEYAMEGLYSTKSDVFSFGVLLLEILTGRRNFLGFQLTDTAHTLVVHAWQMWNEEKGLELMDPLLKDSCTNSNEFLRCIHVGLLCVQEDANKRPTMSSVIHEMLTAERSSTTSLSMPERPAFFTGRSIVRRDQTGPPICSATELTVSDIGPR